MDVRSLSPTPSPPLVGRDRELALLRDRLTAAHEGRGSLVLVSGEAGIGKTALAETLCREAADRGACILTGHCYDRTETPPYGPWIEIARRVQSLPDTANAPSAPRLDGATSQADHFAQVLAADRLPAEPLTRAAATIAAHEERSATMGHRSPVEGFASPHHHLALVRAVAATFVELVAEVLTVPEEGEWVPASMRESGQTRPSNGPISPRECEVLALVVAGRSNKEIAEALFISPFTAKAHVASLLTKLDADNRVHLAGIAIQRGLLGDSGGASQPRVAAHARRTTTRRPISSSQ